jgi:citronellol/citronellal dehydrogenase
MDQAGTPRAGSLRGRTLFITGASRGIGLAIALRAARDGANIVIAAKTDRPHPKLPGTIHTAAAQVEAAGGAALPLVVDIRDEDQVRAAVERAAARFGGLDICVNNASAISLSPTLNTDLKRYDLMQQVNTRGSFVVSQACLPHLLNSGNPHILMLSPPLEMNPRWFAPHLAYSIAKFGMSLCVLGLAEEFRDRGVAVNALWPRTAIATAAVEFALGGGEMLRRSRKPQIVADAAHVILTTPARDLSGRFLVDDEVLSAHGVTDFEPYSVTPGLELARDFFLDPARPAPAGVRLMELGS